MMMMTTLLLIVLFRVASLAFRVMLVFYIILASCSSTYSTLSLFVGFSAWFFFYVCHLPREKKEKEKKKKDDLSCYQSVLFAKQSQDRKKVWCDCRSYCLPAIPSACLCRGRRKVILWLLSSFLRANEESVFGLVLLGQRVDRRSDWRKRERKRKCAYFLYIPGPFSILLWNVVFFAGFYFCAPSSKLKSGCFLGYFSACF